MGKKLSPADSMLIAVKKVDVNPIMNEIHSHPFIWVPVFIILFFAIGNLFEILWLLLRDLRVLVFRLLRYPRRFVRSKTEPIKKFFVKRYGKKKRGERGIWKRK